MRLLLIISVLLLTLDSQLFGAVSPEELAEREARLTAHLHSFAEWVNDICNLTKGQQDQLNDRIKQAITQSQQAYQFPDFPNQIKTEQSRLYDFSPIRFVGIRGAAWGVFQAGLNDNLLKILNEDQQKKYRAAIETRKQTLHESFLAHVINTADRELFLSNQQKEGIRNLFPEKLPLLENGLYWFMIWPRYLKDKPIKILLDSSSIMLTPTQTERIQLLKSSQSGFARFKTLEGRADWNKQLKKSALMQRKKLQSMQQMRVSCLVTRYHLSAENRDYLELASKGAIAKVLVKWKQTTAEKFDLWEKQVAEMVNRKKVVFAYAAVPAIRDSEVLQHPIWEHAVRKVLTEQANQQRKQESRDATNGYAVALLDQELWLTSAQRNQLNKISQRLCLIDKSQYYEAPGFGSQYDLSLLATILYDCDQKELDELLNESQRNVINQLKRQLLESKAGDIPSFVIKTPLGITLLRRMDYKKQ